MEYRDRTTDTQTDRGTHNDTPYLEMENCRSEECLSPQAFSCLVCSLKTEWKKLLGTYILPSLEQHRGAGRGVGRLLLFWLFLNRKAGK